MASKELEALIVLAGKVDPSLQKALRAAQGETNKFSSSSKKLASEFSHVGDIIKGVFVGGLLANGVSALTGKIKELSSQSIDLASDLTEVQNVVDTTFNSSANQINEWADTALEAYGLSELQAKQYTGTLGAMMKSSGITGAALVTMSENLSGLSGDFASFYNLAQDDAFEKIRAGISGETEPLKALGYNMSVANMEAFALSKGIKTSYSQMDQASQTALRYAYLMEVSKDAQGDFAKTLDTSYANQKRLMDTKIQETLAKVISKTLPLLTNGLKVVNGLIDKIDVERIGSGIANIAGHIPEVIQGAIDVFTFIHDNWSTLEPIILGIVSAMIAWKAITIGMKIYEGVMAGIKAGTIKATLAQWGLNAAVIANPMTWVVVAVAAAIGLLIAGIYLLWKNWDKVSNFFVGIWQDHVMPFFGKLGSWFSGIFDSIGNTFKGLINWVIGGINKMIRAINSMKIKVPDWVPALGGKTIGFNIPEIPTFAEGGFANQPSVFGEAGLEAAIPIKYKNPRSLSLLDKTARAIGAEPAGAKPGISLTFNFNGPVSNKNDVAAGVSEAKDYIVQVLDEYFEDKGRVSFA